MDVGHVYPEPMSSAAALPRHSWSSRWCQALWVHSEGDRDELVFSSPISQERGHGCAGALCFVTRRWP